MTNTLHKLSDVEIFAAGTWNDQTFTMADLDEIVRNFYSFNSEGRCPLKLGHDSDGVPVPNSGGQPALGWVQAVRRKGEKLLADFVGIPDVIYKTIKNGLYKYCSIELLTNAKIDGQEHGLMLDAVALLGAAIPAVNGLGDLQRLAASRNLSPGDLLAFSSRFAPLLPREEPAAPVQTDAALAAENTALRAQLAQAAAEKAEFARARTVEVAKAHQRDVLGTLSKAVADKRMLPAHRERIIAAKNLRDPNAALLFSREEAALYCDAHDQAPSIALLFSHSATSAKPGATRTGDEPVSTLAARARLLFAQGKARDTFHALELAMGERPDLAQTVIEHDITA